MKLLNSDRFFLPGTDGRFIHIATVQDGLREYIYIHDVVTKKSYIERIAACGLEFEPDDAIVEAINEFLFDRKVTDLKQGAFVPD